jgi:hypothetical protein
MQNYEDMAMKDECLEVDVESSETTTPTHSPSVLTPPFRPKRKASKIDTVDEELLRIIGKEEDEPTLFGKKIAIGLRNLEPKKCQKAMMEIDQIIYKYEFDED